MTLNVLACVSLVFAAIPCYLFLRNVLVFARLPKDSSTQTSGPISVLIPARNEENSISACLNSILKSRDATFEIVVLDDQSEDATAQLVSEIAAKDSRVRLESAKPLPAGWCGKQHACAQLGQLAKHETLIFIDADVRLAEDSLARIAKAFEACDADLFSGFPRQRTETILEQLMIPLIHFVLLGFLSLRRMRRSSHPAFGAGCGQLFVTSRTAYEKSGGHGGIRSSLHDGIKLPRLYRSKGLSTDLFDATDIATCRMYHNALEVWNGLKKNATEGVASPSLIGPVTAMLLCGQVLPFLLLAFAASRGELMQPWSLCAGVACLLAWLPRITASIRYRQSFVGALFHPLAILVFLSIQWTAFVGSFSHRTVTWKGRPYPAS